MTLASGPLSRPVPVRQLPPGGQDVVVEASAAECTALAADLDLPAVRSLRAEFHLKPIRDGVRVLGRVRADIVQTCVVTLDPFDARVDEPVEADFTEEGPPEPEEGVTEAETDLDAPDLIVGGRVDLGQLATEFLALGLDPYPRKPGIAFDAAPAEAGEESGHPNPFAALASLKTRD